MVKPKFYRDPIHIQIRFEPADLNAAPKRDASDLSWLSQKLINTQEFQRLRLIRQNGLANLVFHGAEHSRFSHSMGVHAVARRMYSKICRNSSEPEDPEWRLTTAIAALTHDLGHGPFSHTLEEILGKEQFNHEEMTRRFLVEDGSAIKGVLREVDEELPSKLELFFEEKKRPQDHWGYKIVSSQLDADRLDYVQRDALFAGLRGHGFDFERLLDLLSHHEGKVAVYKGALTAVESYLIALDQMYRSIYYHRTVRAATQMLLKLVGRAIELHKQGDITIFPVDQFDTTHPMALLVDQGSNVALDVYSRLTDVSLWQLMATWENHKDPVIAMLARRISRRELLKSIEVDETNYVKVNKLHNQAIELTKSMYKNIEGAENHLVAFDSPTRTSYKRYNWKPESDSESIWLLDGNGGPLPLEDFEGSPIIQSFRKGVWPTRLFVMPDVREALIKL